MTWPATEEIFVHLYLSDTNENTFCEKYFNEI